MNPHHDDLKRVESACQKLTQAGQPITFPGVAAEAGIGRATLYRRAELRALVQEHRTRALDAHTLAGLATQIEQLRHSLEAVADKVRRHEETLRHLTKPAARSGRSNSPD